MRLHQVDVGTLGNSSLEWEVGECTQGWEYNTEGYHRCRRYFSYFTDDLSFCLSTVSVRSIVSDLDWVCDNEWIPAMSQVGQ